MIRVSINSAAENRRMSGTRRVIDLVDSALKSQGYQVTRRRWPRLYGSSKVLRAFQWLVWDLFAYGAYSVGDRLLICPTNVAPILRRPGQTVVTFVHDVMVLDDLQFDASYRRYATLVFKIGFHASTLVITPSQYSARRIRKHLGEATPIAVIPYAVPAEHFLEPERRTPTVDFLAIGACEPHKRHSEAIRFAAEVCRARGVRGKFILVGASGRAEGAVQDAVREASDFLDVSRRRAVSDTELRNIIDSSRILLQFSSAEGFGLPPVEAAARGVPVVHSGFGSLPELLPQTGIDVSSKGWQGAVAETLMLFSRPEEYWGLSIKTYTEAGRYHPQTFERAIGRLLESHLGGTNVS